jgi:hypothetical protein
MKNGTKRRRPLAFDKSGRRAYYHARQIASSANLSLFSLRKSALCVRISQGTRVAPPLLSKSDSLPVAAPPPMSKSHYLQTLALFVGKIFIQPQIVRARCRCITRSAAKPPQQHERSFFIAIGMQMISCHRRLPIIGAWRP